MFNGTELRKRQQDHAQNLADAFSNATPQESLYMALCLDAIISRMWAADAKRFEEIKR